MTISSIIRGALQARAATAAMFPPAAHRVYEGYLPDGTPYVPVIGTPYVTMVVLPTIIESPFVGNEVFRHEGLFRINVFGPQDGKGTKSIEDRADAIRAVFSIGLRLATSDNKLLIISNSRSPILEPPDWLQLPMTIGWRYYSSDS